MSNRLKRINFNFEMVMTEDQNPEEIYKLVQSILNSQSSILRSKCTTNSHIDEYGQSADQKFSLSEKELWNTIKSLNWQETQSVKKTRKEFLKLSNEVKKEVRSFVEQKINELRENLGVFEKLGKVSMPCEEDYRVNQKLAVFAHVVGCGEFIFNCVKSNLDVVSNFEKITENNSFSAIFNPVKRIFSIPVIKDNSILTLPALKQEKVEIKINKVKKSSRLASVSNQLSM